MNSKEGSITMLSYKMVRYINEKLKYVEDLSTRETIEALDKIQTVEMELLNKKRDKIIPRLNDRQKNIIKMLELKTPTLKKML